MLYGICAPEELRNSETVAVCSFLRNVTIKLSFIQRLFCKKKKKMSVYLCCHITIQNIFILKPASNSDPMSVLEVLWWLGVQCCECCGLWEALRTWWLITKGKRQLEMFRISHHVKEKN